MPLRKVEFPVGEANGFKFVQIGRERVWLPKVDWEIVEFPLGNFKAERTWGGGLRLRNVQGWRTWFYDGDGVVVKPKNAQEYKVDWGRLITVRLGQELWIIEGNRLTVGLPTREVVTVEPVPEDWRDYKHIWNLVARIDEEV